jgi:hypothetical protein
MLVLSSHEDYDLQVAGVPVHAISDRTIITPAEHTSLRTLTLKGTTESPRQRKSDPSFILLDSHVVKDIFSSSLRVNAPAWRPTSQTSKENKNETGIEINGELQANQQISNSNNESEMCQVSSSHNKLNVSRPQNSTALPLLDLAPPRNGGYTFFSDGTDHEFF